MFEIFRDGDGPWCARRSDGLVGGVFRDRAEAERFARMEDAAAIAQHGPHPQGLPITNRAQELPVPAH